MPSQQGTLRLTVGLLSFLIGVICIVVFCVIPLVQKRTTQVRETALRQTLSHMRKAIKDYSDEKKELPHSLNDLVDAKLLSEIPIDPVTDEWKWQVVVGDTLNGSKVTPGIVDVHSFSSAKSSKNTPYSEW
jgi:type II secretory pathway pseudopilin PulG